MFIKVYLFQASDSCDVEGGKNLHTHQKKANPFFTNYLLLCNTPSTISPGMKIKLVWPTM